MFSRILVPLDGSKLAECAIPHAIQFAHIFGSSLVLLRVLDPTSERESRRTPEPFIWQVRKAEADVYLKEVAKKIQQMNLEVETILLEGKTPENILDYAQSSKIDLLVISTHGAGGLSRWNTSGVFRKVVEKIYLPVLVIRAYRSPVEDEDAGIESETAKAENSMVQENSLHQAASTTSIDLSQPIHYKRILLPIDASRRAECTFPAATALATATGASLVLVSVVRPPELPLPQPYPPEVKQLVEKFIAISRETAGSYLEELKIRLNVPVETRLIDHDSAMHAIHNLAEQENTDLVIFCAHGRTGKIDLPYGSVSRGYLEHGTRNTLVVQDVHLTQVRPTEAEIAAEKYGRR